MFDEAKFPEIFPSKSGNVNNDEANIYRKYAELDGTCRNSELGREEVE